MRIDGIDLGQFKSATMKQAPLEGTMLGRFKIHGTGSSVHKFASSSDSSMSVVIPHGQISDVIAELTGINVLRGLGLILAKGRSQTEIRCTARCCTPLSASRRISSPSRPALRRRWARY